MDHVATRGLTQSATRWVATPDGFGGATFTLPEKIGCRWEERTEQFFSMLDKKETVSRAVVFVDRDVKVGDWLYPVSSDATDPTILDGAYKVQRFDRVPDLRNLLAIRKAYL